jgi:methionyl-tRNA formyltransferase
MRTLFFGSSAFAVPSLHVTAEKTQLAGVVTQPDQPAGRGHKLQPTPVKVAARELGLRVYEPATLRALADDISAERFDCFALASYGRILPQEMLGLPALGALNVHPSLLPKYRGATPIQSALRDGASTTGVSIMLMDAGMDTGDLVLQSSVEIEPDDDYGSLHDRLAFFGADLLGDAIELGAKGAFPRRPQHGEPSLTRPIRKEDLEIDWSWPPQRIVNTIRAFAPAPCARATVEGENVKLLHAHVDDDRVVIDELIAPGRGRMSWDSYLRSRRDRQRK